MPSKGTHAEVLKPYSDGMLSRPTDAFIYSCAYRCSTENSSKILNHQEASDIVLGARCVLTGASENDDPSHFATILAIQLIAWRLYKHLSASGPLPGGLSGSLATDLIDRMETVTMSGCTPTWLGGYTILQIIMLQLWLWAAARSGDLLRGHANTSKIFVQARTLLKLYSTRFSGLAECEKLISSLQKYFEETVSLARGWFENEISFVVLESSCGHSLPCWN